MSELVIVEKGWSGNQAATIKHSFNINDDLCPADFLACVSNMTGYLAKCGNHNDGWRITNVSYSIPE
jgi:hypothetical protein